MYPEYSVLVALKAVWIIFLTGMGVLWDTLWGRLDRDKLDQRILERSQQILEDARVKLHVEGAEHIQPGVIYMGNHQSNYDPVVFAAVIPGVRMVGKVEVFRIPLFGKALRLAGFLPIDRKNRQKAIESLHLAKQAILAGQSYWMSPEGSRYKTLGPFKKGPFITAIEAGAPIVPMTLQGTYELMPPGSLRVKLDTPVTVRFYPPIDPRTYTLDQRDQLMAEVRKVIEEGLVKPVGTSTSSVRTDSLDA